MMRFKQEDDKQFCSFIQRGAGHFDLRALSTANRWQVRVACSTIH